MGTSQIARKVAGSLIRALALGNTNVKCKGYLAFQALKCITSGNAIAKYCKFFCNSVTVQFYL